MMASPRSKAVWAVFLLWAVLAVSQALGEQAPVGGEAVASTQDGGGGSEYDGSPFVPTYEWQEIKPGQAIPQGLHVYMDMTTGEKRAKLMDPEPEDEALAVSLMAVAVEDTAGNEDYGRGSDEMEAETEETFECVADDCGAKVEEDAKNKIASEDENPDEADMMMSESSQQIFSALSHLPASSLGVDRDKLADLSPEDFDRVLQSMWKRRQAELQEAMEHIVDEADLMRQLIENLVKTFDDDFEEKADILVKMESFVEDIDMAYDFHTMGGFLAVIRELNSTSPDVQASAAWVIGTAVQNVREAQDWAVEDGALPKLVHALRAVDPHGGNDKLERKLLYAMASMLRNNNWAKSQFEALGAATDLLSLVSKVEDRDVVREAVLRQKKVSAKVFRLISDIVRESKGAEAAAAVDVEEAEDPDEVVPLTVLSTSQKGKKKEEAEERHFDDGAASREAEKRRNDKQHKGSEVLVALGSLHQELASPQWFRAIEHWLSLTATFPDLLLGNLETYIIAYASLHEHVWDHCARNPVEAHVGADVVDDQNIWESGCFEGSACLHVWPASGRSHQDEAAGSEWGEAVAVVEVLNSLPGVLNDAVKEDQIDREYANELEYLVNRVKERMPHTRKLLSGREAL